MINKPMRNIAVEGRKPRICVFVRQLDGGGAQKIMLKLANALADAGGDIQIATLKSSGLFKDILRPNVSVHTLRARRLLSAPLALGKHIAKHQPDILFSTEVVPNIVSIAGAQLSGRRAAMRIVIREALHPSTAMRKSPHRATRLGYRIARFFYPKADAVIAIAKAMTGDLSRIARVDASRITSININPCIDDRVLALAGEPAPHPWLNEAVPCAVAVGRLAEQKGFDVAIAAVAKVAAKRPMRLLIVGDGPSRESLAKQIEGLRAVSYIQLAGKTANPYAYMANSTMFLMPSRYEGLGNVLIEAIACGAPSVACDCLVGPRETLADGAYGELVPVDDVDAFAAAIERVLDNPPDRARLRQRGLDYTAEESLKHYIPIILGSSEAELGKPSISR